LRSGPSGWISTVELKRRLDAGTAITVVDVRGPEEFGGPLGHIPGARNLPLSEFACAPDELAASGERPIALVCATDKRSARAAEVLRSAGFRDVLIVRGGMVQWQRDAVGAR
jgi:rhodanese-related sulfurtransferase